MISISLSIDEAQLRFVRDSLTHMPNAAKKAIARAVNRAVEGARTDAVKAVCAEYAIRPTDVRKTIRIIRATQDKPEAQIISTGRPVPLVKFKALPKKPPAKGTPVKRRRIVIAGVKFGSAKAMPHSFVAEMKNGHIGIYSRKPGAGRNPIEQHYGPSSPQMIGNTAVLEYIKRQALGRLDKELRHQVQYLSRGGK
jgi:hypothetical protein